MNKILKNKKGMTLVEVLTAMTLLAMMIFCFAPLFLSYLQTINISGVKMQETYEKAGTMHKLIGNKGTDANSGYETNVSSIPLTLDAPSTLVTKNGKTQQINAVKLSVANAAGVDGYLDPIKGNYIVTDPNDISKGFTTIYTDSINSNINCFPVSLTDDFAEAHITIVANGFNFVNENFNSDTYKLFCTKNVQGKPTLSRLTFGRDYKLQRVSGSDNILMLTLYGGTDVSFENSPLVFNYNGGAYTKEIEIDAPQMIMVGEQAPDGGYYYYVSRGELDEDGNLIVIRRKMNSTDAKTGGTTTLFSAMNDVEWVPAESGNNNEINGEKYGYYVMCGDNGQIRRFWKNPTTGNYYWGGDYTDYTNITIDTADSSPVRSFVGTNTYSNSVSYSFAYRTNAGSAGFNLANNSDKGNYLQSSNIASITAFNNSSLKSYFYVSDGKMYYYQTKKGASVLSTPLTYTTISNIIKNNGYAKGISAGGSTVSTEKSNLIKNGFEDQTWITASANAFSDITGFNTYNDSIVLTSVDGIVLTGKGTAYVTNDATSDNADLAGGTLSVNGSKTYPTSSYTLYCGYIPAVMDLWSTKSGTSTSFKDAISQTEDGTFYDFTTNLPRLSTKLNGGTQNYALWKGNLGMTPYLTYGASLEIAESGKRAYYKKNSEGFLGLGGWDHPSEYVDVYPYNNLGYTITGKAFDASANVTSNDIFNISKVVRQAGLSYSVTNGKQAYMTNGKVVDVTIGYLSNPLAVHLKANPTDDIVYDLSNDKADKIFYWNNLREATTYLDSASAMIPNGDQDIPVSLLVGYTMGGLVEFEGSDLYANTIMNNGIVMLRAGTAEYGTQSNANSETGEYYAKDNTGYKLDAEANTFHQFYYLNSKYYYKYSDEGTRKGVENTEMPWRSLSVSTGSHIGDVWGADYWRNNDHIDYVSMTGGQPDSANNKDSGSYEYLRAHPLSNTKVTCVAWGNTWDNNPEAMWGTENGTLLSWSVDLNKAQDGTKRYSNGTSGSSNWNDRSVAAEFQSYKWIDNVNGKKFALDSFSWKNTVGAHIGSESGYTGATFTNNPSSMSTDPTVYAFEGYFDAGSREAELTPQVGFISTLENINDVAFANDYWVAVGDQSDKNPADYCATGSVENVGKILYGGSTDVKAYTGTGKGGSWVNVKYWFNRSTDKVRNESNNTCLWKAVKISNNENYNIVQINNLNGVWYATGYVDNNNNDEWDSGERAVICWTSDPLAPCGTTNGWTESTSFIEYQNGNRVEIDASQIGGINSVATRS